MLLEECFEVFRVLLEYTVVFQGVYRRVGRDSLKKIDTATGALSATTCARLGECLSEECFKVLRVLRASPRIR